MTPNISNLHLAPEAPPTKRDCATMEQAAKYIQHTAEDWYHTTRRKLGHSRLILEPVVLKPICDDCLVRFDLPTTLDRCWITKAREEIVVVLPEKTRPERLAFYDRGKRLVHLWRKEESSWRDVGCSDCRQPIHDEYGIVSVYEEPFAEYFGLPDPEDAPRNLRGDRKKKVRDRLAKIYGGRCFECGRRRKLTLDHIEPRALGGTWLTTNLQPFCDECQKKKAALPAENVVIALDMLLRPLPSDSYDGPLW
jgi:hypothetical protein